MIWTFIKLWILFFSIIPIPEFEPVTSRVRLKFRIHLEKDFWGKSILNEWNENYFLDSSSKVLFSQKSKVSLKQDNGLSGFAICDFPAHNRKHDCWNRLTGILRKCTLLYEFFYLCDGSIEKWQEFSFEKSLQNAGSVPNIQRIYQFSLAKEKNQNLIRKKL